jgi:hypothetical protein
MNLFQRHNAASNPEAIVQIKRWIYDALQLDPTMPISISQLQCTEPGCPPLETVIAVMTQPPTTYKIHKPASDIDRDDVINAVKP